MVFDLFWSISYVYNGEKKPHIKHILISKTISYTFFAQALKLLVDILYNRYSKKIHNIPFLNVF